jgi:uncharacterized protein (TIGR03083 family)
MITVAQLGLPVDLRPLMARERAALIDLLAELRPDEWTAPTACPGWTVRDVAAHLLHDDLRRLSHMRDGHDGGPRRRGEETLAAFINRTNEQWVAAASFLSPGLLVELLTFTAGSVQTMWAEAHLDAPSIGVSWAGVDPAPVWLDAAREYTEAWTHRQQIRDATGRPSSMTKRSSSPSSTRCCGHFPSLIARSARPPGRPWWSPSRRMASWSSRWWPTPQAGLRPPVAEVTSVRPSASTPTRCGGWPRGA